MLGGGLNLMVARPSLVPTIVGAACWSGTSHTVTMTRPATRRVESSVASCTV